MLQLETTTNGRTEAVSPSTASPGDSPSTHPTVDDEREEDATSEKTTYEEGTGQEKEQKVDSEEQAPPTSAESPPYTILSRRAQWAMVSLLMTAALFSPLSANIYLPALPLVADELDVSTQAVNLSVTLFMVFQGIMPTFWGAICDVRGRRPVYLATFTVWVALSLPPKGTTS